MPAESRRAGADDGLRGSIGDRSGTSVTRTINGSFDPRANSLNALRLLMASAVLVGHSWPLTGRDVRSAFGIEDLARWAVLGFFAISGYLITRSRLNGRPARDFYKARVLRIMPAFIVALLLVAFVVSPLSQLIDPTATWSPRSALTFIGRNLLLYPPAPLAQPGIDGTLADVPFPETWDGPLWTLWWEAWCYIAIGVAASLLPRRALPWAALTGFVGFTLVAVAGAAGAPVSEMVLIVAPMFLAFLSGMCLLLFGDRIIVNRTITVLAVLALVVLVWLDLWQQLGTLPMAYLLMVLGSVLPLSKVGAKFDISYGVYIYAWPVQQMVVLTSAGSWPIGSYILVVFAFTLPVAFLSSWLIERPAMRLKNRTKSPSAASRTPTRRMD